MLRYLLKFGYVYLYMYMLSSITFGYNLFNEIFINIKLIFIYFHTCTQHVTYVYTTRDKVPALISKTTNTMTHNENIEDILYLHIFIFIIKEEEFVFILPIFQNNI